MAKDYVDELEESFYYKYANAYSLDDLRKIRDRLYMQNKDTKIIDEAIKIKIRRETSKPKVKEKKKGHGLLFLSAILSGFRSGMSSSPKVSDWEMQELINKKDYEPYNFEEDEIEEDDFYSDDLD